MIHKIFTWLWRGCWAGGGDVGHLLLQLSELVKLGVQGQDGGDVDSITQHRVQALHDDHHARAGQKQFLKLVES